MHHRPRQTCALLLAGLLAQAAWPGGAALAQPGWGGGYGVSGTGRNWEGRNWAGREQALPDPREGKLDSEVFVADDAAGQLGRGTITVTAAPGSTAEAREEATHEAAIIDQLAKVGYDTATRDATGGQICEVAIIHDELSPAEEKRSPLSGAMEVGVSNRGSGVALALNYDASKPRGALIESRIEIRIRDRVTAKPLFEGRARIATRIGDTHWNDEKIATRLAAAIFAKFPRMAPAAVVKPAP